jgi:hypothetical protein
MGLFLRLRIKMAIPTLGAMIAAMGSPAEWGAVATTKLYWDDTNTRLGIGAASPTFPLTVSKLSASNGSRAYMVGIQAGDDVTLGPLQMAFGIYPSATAGSRYVSIEAADSVDYRNLVLAPDGGKVGIGTTSPQTALHIKGSGASAGILRYETTGTGNRMFQWYISGPGANYDTLYLSANTTSGGGTFAEMMCVQADGKVGIGTASPVAKLSVGSGGNAWTTDNWSRAVEVPAFHAIKWVKGTNYAWGMGQYSDSFYFFRSTADDASAAPVYAMSIAGPAGDVWMIANCSALSFTDRTPYPESTKQAYDAVNSMVAKDGQIDHATLDPFIKGVPDKDKDGKETPTRDIGATLSCLAVVVKDINIRLKKLEEPK